MLEDPEVWLDAIKVQNPLIVTLGQDEDPGDESGGTVNNLSGRHLQAGASTVFKSGKRIGDKSLEPTSDSQKKKTSHHRLNSHLGGKRSSLG